MFASSNTSLLPAVGLIITKTYLAGDTPVLQATVGLREVSGVWTETSGSSNFRTEFCAKSSNVSVPSSIPSAVRARTVNSIYFQFLLVWLTTSPSSCQADTLRGKAGGCET